jgi:hypothetical protein
MGFIAPQTAARLLKTVLFGPTAQSKSTLAMVNQQLRTVIFKTAGPEMGI